MITFVESRTSHRSRRMRQLPPSELGCERPIVLFCAKLLQVDYEEGVVVEVVEVFAVSSL